MNFSVMMRLKVIRSITIIISHTQILLHSHNKYLSITVENLPRQSYAKPQTLPFWKKKKRKKRKMQGGNWGRGKGKAHGILLRLKHQV